MLVGLDQQSSAKSKASLQFVKTQFGGLGTHIIIVTLLKYIAGKYLESFTLEDDAGYFETGNLIIAEQKFENYQQYLRATSEAIKGLSTEEHETIEDYAKRLARYLEQTFKRK